MRYFEGRLVSEDEYYALVARARARLVESIPDNRTPEQIKADQEAEERYEKARNDRERKRIAETLARLYSVPEHYPDGKGWAPTFVGITRRDYR